MRTISIFGATGSIGCNTVDLVQRQGGGEALRVVALTGGRNIALLARQARALRAELAVTAHPECLDDLRSALAGSGTQAAAGPAALAEAAARPVDWAMSAIVGAAGLAATMALARHGGILALANKESIVCAGDLLLATCARHGTTLLPVDSEHSAIFQALQGEDRASLRRIILTASGGPFLDWPLARMAAATPEQAIAHPNWSMGARISVDSASMFNKALEVIEAAHLFAVAPEQIEVVIHPQSIVHSMVEFVDGAIMAHMGTPDMRGAIGYALNWPARAPGPVAPLDFSRLSRLDFAAPDPDRFPALGLAARVLAQGGLAGAVMNAAKEVALDAFLARQIGFLDMVALVDDVLTHTQLAGAAGDLADVMAADAQARAASAHWLRNRGAQAQDKGQG